MVVANGTVKMGKFFNTTGPCNPEKHYMLPPSARLVGAQLSRYIKDQLYWVLHAPRQSGKTTFLQSWMREINASGEAVACYVSVERCQEFPRAEDSIPAIVSAVQEYAKLFLGVEFVPPVPQGKDASLLSLVMQSWSELVAPKPMVVLFDEVDVLQDQSLISFLRQLRGGFAARGVGKFPVSVALVGMRDLRDYLMKSKDGVMLNPGSPFNIKQDSASLSNFTEADVFALAGQHTQATGQQFDVAALEFVFDQARGQPWLTNAMLQKCVWNIAKEESGETIALKHVRQARDMLIEERAVHLDSLVERLRDPRVRRVVQTILVGEIDPTMADNDDLRLCMDLGLVTLERGTPIIANPIYREVIARVLSYSMQLAVPAPEFKWLKNDGTLDMDELLREFQKFWRRHSEVWEEKSDYTEAFPHLLVMAFLQRVVNGGGRIEREYAAGRGRMDLAIQYGGTWSIIEIKLVHPADGRDGTMREGLDQVNWYRERIDPGCGAYLVLFDRTPAGRTLPWPERLTWERVETPAGAVTVVGG